MDEFSFINSIKQHSYKQSSLIKGIGDDAAVIRQPTQDIVCAVDTLVEGVHFSRQTMEPWHIGYRALAANVSDLAAMGASPAFYLVSIVIPKTWSSGEINQIYVGMKQLATKFRMDLIGGDTVSGQELSVSITVIGYVERNKARYRSLAKEGDKVFVTGTLGDSQAGFHILTNPGYYTDEVYYKERHQQPLPRVDFASKTENISRIVFNDISDGIANEANEIAEASKVSLILYEKQLPIKDSYEQFPPKLQHKWKLFGGEDFELLGTVSNKDWNELQIIAKETNTPLKEIGYVDDSQSNIGQVFLHENKQTYRLQKKGYTHLK
ncbi:thiamine-phosphate kinase [Virgibacillus byunsanensis]|uniref:Thiamine-monophosphate kinase n=1 Tax=Virgibacillus byunsanensis TaxID=570945 RepID=A0ABW3LJX2_9BACI